MGFFDIFRRKTANPQKELTAQELELKEHNRQLSLMRRNLDLEIMVKEAELRKAEIEAELADIYGDDDDQDGSIDGIFSNFIQSALKKQQQPQQQTPIIQEVNLSDEQIKKYWDDLNPIYKQVAKGMKDDQVLEFIKQKEPNLSQDTLKRILNVVRS